LKTLIIGGGIAGSILSRMHGYRILEKAKGPGGRCSSGRLPNQNIFDKGATIFKDRFQYKINNQRSEFHFRNFLYKFNPNLKYNAVPNQADLFSISQGFGSLCSYIIPEGNLITNRKITHIEKNNKQEWDIHCEDGGKFITDRIIFTPPLPQSLEIIKNTDFFPTFTELSLPYLHYKKSLVLTLYWDKNVHLKNPIYSFYYPGEDIEYISIESKKIKPFIGFCISIQFSDSFSNTNKDFHSPLERKPSAKAFEYINKNLNLIIEKIQLDQIIENPNEVRSHFWNYSLPKKSMFDKNSEIDFDSIEIKNLIDLFKSSNLFLLGDWIFGPRLPKVAMGTLVFSNHFL
jgi:predicted NAD/FAD-dependent oxidoreductase